MATVEETSEFHPRFNADGLIPAIACDAGTGAVLMLAYMNELALQRTLETGQVHYWSRSRGQLWHKGETSGEVQHVESILTDCDQDALLLKVRVGGRGATCHTGRASCFYRQIEAADGGGSPSKLKSIDDKRLFDPRQVYSGN